MTDKNGRKRYMRHSYRRNGAAMGQRMEERKANPATKTLFSTYFPQGKEGTASHEGGLRTGASGGIARLFF